MTVKHLIQSQRLTNPQKAKGYFTAEVDEREGECELFILQ